MKGAPCLPLRRRRRSEHARRKVLVEHQHALPLTIDEAKLVKDVVDAILFLDLFGHEPLKEDVRGVVFLFNGDVDEVVDTRGDKPFMFKGMSEGIQRILPFCGGASTG